MRLLITAFVLGIPEHKVRCISPDVGGAFGSKIFLYTEWVLVAWASKRLGGRPVKWVESRRENYIGTIHGRDHITDIEVAGTRDGVITGLKVRTWANLGGRLSTIGPGVPTTLYGRVLSGPYAIPNVWCEVTGVYTNTVFVDAYRGAGRPEATYVVERAMDLFAAEIGMDRAEIRRRNFLPTDSLPAQERERPVQVLERPGAGHRFRATTRRRWSGPSRWPATPTSTRPRRRRSPAASTWAWASRATSRCAAWRRPSGSAPWARAGAPRCGSRPTSRST